MNGIIGGAPVLKPSYPVASNLGNVALKGEFSSVFYWYHMEK